MNNTALFYRTVDILLDAYQRRELKHGTARACAVGNIMSACDLGQAWVNVIQPSVINHEKNQFIPGRPRLILMHEIEKRGLAYAMWERSGYSPVNLSRIEVAFESSIIKLHPDDNKGIFHRMIDQTPYHCYMYYSTMDPIRGQYLGLCAVIEELKQIHMTDTEGAMALQKADFIYQERERERFQVEARMICTPIP